MPTQRFEVTWPAAKSAKLLAAWRRHFGQKIEDENGDPIDPPVDYTANEIRALIGKGIENEFRSVFERHMRALNREAEDNLEAVNPTVIDEDV